MTDGRTDGQTDGQTDGRTDGGDCNIPYAFLKKRGDNKGIAPLPMVYIFLSLFVLLECVLMLMTSTTETYF